MIKLIFNMNAICMTILSFNKNPDALIYERKKFRNYQ